MGASFLFFDHTFFARSSSALRCKTRVKYVFATRRALIPKRTKETQVFTQPARGSNAPVYERLRAAREWPRFHDSRRCERRSEEDPRGIGIQSAAINRAATPICPPRDPLAQLNQIFQAAPFIAIPRKPHRARSSIKTGLCALHPTRHWFFKIDDRLPSFPFATFFASST